MIKIIIKIILFFCVLYGLGFIFYTPYQSYHLKKMLGEENISEINLFQSDGKDFTTFYSFSFKKEPNKLNKFKNIDKDYYKNSYIMFIFEELDIFIENEEKLYNDKEIETLKKIKKNIKNLEKFKNTQYRFFFIQEGLSDNVICIYNKFKNEGYCIINYM